MFRYPIKQLVNASGITRDCQLVISDGLIQEINSLPVSSSRKQYCYAIPGFIDLHIHGALGADVMDGTAVAYATIAHALLTSGTTSFVGTTVTAPLQAIERVLLEANAFQPLNAQMAAQGLQAKLLGIHLEGPWISERNLGAHNPAYVSPPGPEALTLLRKYSDIVRVVTFSYHHPGSKELLRTLLMLGILPACGHDEGIDEEIEVGFREGIRLVTHVYSCNSSVQRRQGFKHLGTLEMGLLTDGVSVEVIADERHITRYFWDFVRHNKSPTEIIISSDGIRATGLPEDPQKVYQLGGMPIIIDQGVAWTSDHSLFAGSVTTMYRMFKTLVTRWKVNISDAVRMTSYNQVELLGLQDGLGTLELGKTADLILLDEKYQIQKILKSGIEVAI